MKKLLLVLVLFFPSIGWSEEIKLSCRIKLVTENWDGTISREEFNDVIEISDRGVDKFIIPSSDKLGTVITKKHYPTSIIDDSSTPSKWDITVTEENRGIGVRNSMIIDRNTGNIWYSSSTTMKGNVLTKSASGSCQKIDVSKKKF